MTENIATLFSIKGPLDAGILGRGTSSQKLKNTHFELGLKKLRTYNHFHNILRLFDVLTSFTFTTSETMRDYYL